MTSAPALCPAGVYVYHPAGHARRDAAEPASYAAERLQIPAELAGMIDPETVRRTQAYEADKAWFGIGAALFDAAVTIIFLFGLFAWYDGWIRGLELPFVAEGFCRDPAVWCRRNSRDSVLPV
jgi:hypothetical protein